MLELFVCVFGLIIYIFASVATDLFEEVLPNHYKYDADDPTGPDDDLLEPQVSRLFHKGCAHARRVRRVRLRDRASWCLRVCMPVALCLRCCPRLAHEARPTENCPFHVTSQFECPPPLPPTVPVRPNADS